MKTTGAIQVPVSRHVPILPLVVAMGVLLLVIGAGALWHGSASDSGGASVRVERSIPGIVNGAGVARIVRHRAGISLLGVTGVHARAWENVGLDEGLNRVALVRTLRLSERLSPMQLKWLEARRG